MDSFEFLLLLFLWVLFTIVSLPSFRRDFEAAEEERERNFSETGFRETNVERNTREKEEKRARFYEWLFDSDSRRKRAKKRSRGYPTSSSSAETGMCKECGRRPVMGGKGGYRSSTCEICLLEFDGDD